MEREGKKMLGMNVREERKKRERREREEKEEREWT